MFESTSFICSVCGKKFSKKYNLKRHEIEVHKIVAEFFQKYQCLLCKETTNMQTALFWHYEDSHNVKIETEEIPFNTTVLFYAWKSEIEKETNFKFSKISGDKTNANNSVVSYYKCHRSGKYVSQGKRERSLKTQGTCKNGGTCPASMTVTKADDGKISVHFIKTHVGHTAELGHPMANDVESSSFICNVCDKKFFKKHHLKRHEIEVHKIVTEFFQKYQCLLCKETTNIQTALFRHYGDSHNVKVETEDIPFNTTELFYAWKSEIEKQTNSKFSKFSGDKTHANNSVISYYKCHRSGKYVSQGKGERSLKTQGTCKIGATCPASITVRKADDGKVSVHFIKTHLGHTAELDHLVLNSTDRDWLASKIAAKVPFKAILDEVRDSISDSKLERLHLLTRKDLHNIKGSYNLNSCVRHQNDAVSMNS